jgi:tRNA(adenine34) deaminase
MTENSPEMEIGQTPKQADERRRSSDEWFMRQALAEAHLALDAGEVPVGAVLVHDGQIVARAHNSPISLNDPTAHAEMLVIRQAAHELANYRLNGVTLYVTMEPCAMCAGALVTARVERLVFACRDIRFGAVRSKFRLADSDLLNHRVEIQEGVLAAEATELIQRFFASRR